MQAGWCEGGLLQLRLRLGSDVTCRACWPSACREHCFQAFQEQRYLCPPPQDEGVAFLLTESQIVDERMLVLVNDLLASGEVPGGRRGGAVFA